jgi:hypothetical protein
MKTRRFFAGVRGALAGPAGAHADHDHPPAPTTAPAAARSLAPTPLAARFDLSFDKLKTDWYLWRDADRIETANRLTGQNDIWTRDAERQQYTYRRVFHPERRIVDYTPGELRTRHAEPDWAKLASVISPQLLDALKAGTSKRLFGQKAVRYSGIVGGQKIDLWWLEQARLPASLQMSGHGRQMRLQLRELQAAAPAAWPHAEEARIADYGQLDAADFGDMESDPFVARLLQQEGHQHTH